MAISFMDGGNRRKPQTCRKSLTSFIQNVGQDFIVLDFFHGRKILKADERDGKDPQNWEKNSPAGRFTCMNPVHGDINKRKELWFMIFDG
jgi:hypothetical protein